MQETLTITVGAFTFIVAILAAAFTIALLVTYSLTKRSARREKQQAMKQSRSTLGGKFSEQIAPFLPGFPEDLKLSEGRFLGSPVDFLFFKGMDEKNINGVVFLEVKSGKSSLNQTERTLRDAIRAKRVEWREYRVPEEVTWPDVEASLRIR